ncbi:MAG TPA: serine hydrolase domain-containing protein [Anaerolineales bacterium]|nr:serine hydrolase domain-containing protein [Anaerolineales bacterium]
MTLLIKQHPMLVLVLAPVLIVAVWFVIRSMEKVAPYQPPADRDLSGWGTMDQETATRLESALDADVNRLGVPGFQVSLQTADGQTWYGVSGTVDPQRRVPLRRDHLMRIGSVTKTFVAVVILQLVEEDRLSLDDKLARWFPQFPDADRITIRDLLTHRSGIFNFLESPKVLASLFFSHYTWEAQALIDIAAESKSVYAPGETYYYSNTNYVLLGLIAEQVTGEDSAALIRERISTPLGLHDTYLVPNENAPEALVSGYDRDLIPLPGLFENTPDNISISTAAYTSGAMISTAEDLRIFYDGLFSGKLISPAMLKETTTFLPATDSGTPQLTGYGLGLFRLEIGGEEVWASLGEFIGSMTMVVYSPSQHDIVAIIGNLSLYDYVSVWENLTDVSRASLK